MVDDNNGPSSDKLRRSLFAYLVIALLILSTLLSISVITPLYRRLKGAESRNLVHASEMLSMTIVEWGNRVRAVALQITSRSRIREVLEHFNRGEVSLEEARSFTTPKLQDAMNRSQEVIGITRLDIHNRILAQCGVPIDPATGPQLDGSGETSVNPVPVGIDGGLAVVIGARIKNRQGQTAGVDMVLFSLKQLKGLLQEKSRLGKNERIVLGYMSEDRVYSVFPVDERQEAARMTFADSESLWPVLKNAIIGNSGILQAGDMVMAYSPIQGWSWGLLVAQSEDELYSSLNMILALVILMSLFIFLVCLVGFRIMLKPLSNRILLNAGELEQIIEKKTEQLNASLREKEILLKEIHHRVKNNLSVVAGLLGLQAERADSREVKNILHDSQNRVHSMSAIHDTLYQGDDLSSIEMKSYLWNLANTITRSYEVRGNVRLDVDADPVYLSVVQASPIGLIVNELIANSMKYAFLKDQDGEISIRLKEKDGHIVLQYSDNGPGIPVDFDWENPRSLGLKLVKMLTEKQLKGTFRHENANGARFTLGFHVPD